MSPKFCHAGNWSSAETLFTFKYDYTSPVNPGTPCTAYADSSKAVAITNNIWQNLDASPYFEWSGAGDISSQVAGYTIYWGTSSTGDPGTGTVQTVATYSASAVPSESIHYLRVRTKDNAGNWSSAVTLFTFKYDATSPNNPTSPCNAWNSTSKNFSITNDSWQNQDATPYFEWSGAGDISGIAGYSVFWGISEDDPGTNFGDTIKLFKNLVLCPQNLISK